MPQSAEGGQVTGEESWCDVDSCFNNLKLFICLGVEHGLFFPNVLCSEFHPLLRAEMHGTRNPFCRVSLFSLRPSHDEVLNALNDVNATV